MPAASAENSGYAKLRQLSLSRRGVDSRLTFRFIDTQNYASYSSLAQRLVLKLSPARQELVVELGQLYLGQEKFDLAIQTFQALRNAEDRSMQKQAEMLIRSIERLQKQAAERNLSRAPEASGGTRREPAATVENGENQIAPHFQSDQIFEALLAVKTGEQRIQGTFVKLDCDRSGVRLFHSSSKRSCSQVSRRRVEPCSL